MLLAVLFISFQYLTIYRKDYVASASDDMKTKKRTK
jgi:hypothetical protein